MSGLAWLIAVALFFVSLSAVAMAAIIYVFKRRQASYDDYLRNRKVE